MYVLAEHIAMQLWLTISIHGCVFHLEPSACIVTAACEHSYHSNCILDWVAKRDDCPNCRAGMWDAAEFDRMMEEEHTSRSGRFVNVEPTIMVNLGC